MNSTSLNVEYYFLNWRYQSQAMTTFKTSFLVWNMSKLGLDDGRGLLQFPHYCEIYPDGNFNNEIKIGKPNEAEEILRFLNENKKRLQL